jgi:uncharacterized protein YjiS (DUF1127 family)
MLDSKRIDDEDGPIFASSHARRIVQRAPVALRHANDDTAPAARPRRGGLWTRVWAQILQWRSRARERRQLAAMNDYLRRDIGITGVDVWREANKPFWRG